MTFDPIHHARALERLASSAASLAETVQRERPGELARHAAVLAVDLAAAARAAREFADELERTRAGIEAGT